MNFIKGIFVAALLIVAFSCVGSGVILGIATVISPKTGLILYYWHFAGLIAVALIACEVLYEMHYKLQAKKRLITKTVMRKMRMQPRQPWH